MNKRQLFASSLAAVVAGCAAVGEAQIATSRTVKLVFMFHRRPGMAFGDFSRYWREQHAPIGAALPGVRKYVQNHASATFDGSPPPCDGFAELWFDDMESLQRALASPEAQAALVDSASFIDVQRIQTFVVDEVTIV